jgi:hypothetical protein
MEARKLARREGGALVLQDAAGRILEYRAYPLAGAAASKQSAPKGMAERRPAPYAPHKRMARRRA